MWRSVVTRMKSKLGKKRSTQSFFSNQGGLISNFGSKRTSSPNASRKSSNAPWDQNGANDDYRFDFPKQGLSELVNLRGSHAQILQICLAFQSLFLCPGS